MTEKNTPAPARWTRAAAARDARALAIRSHLLRILEADTAERPAGAGPRFATATAMGIRVELWSARGADGAGVGWAHHLRAWAMSPRLPGAPAVVLDVTWDDAGAFEVERFERGAWEGDALSLRPPAAGRRP
jgi:hypothetical protein